MTMRFKWFFMIVGLLCLNFTPLLLIGEDKVPEDKASEATSEKTAVEDDDIRNSDDIEKTGYLHYEKDKEGWGKNMIKIFIQAPEEGAYSIWLLIRAKPRDEKHTLRATVGENFLCREGFNSSAWTWIRLQRNMGGGNIIQSINFDNGQNELMLSHFQGDGKVNDLIVDVAAILLSKNSQYTPTSFGKQEGKGIVYVRLSKQTSNTEPTSFSRWEKGPMGQSEK